jgi:hypothetical protein
MARVKLAEYRAKKLITDTYPGVTIHKKTMDTSIRGLDPNVEFVVKEAR